MRRFYHAGALFVLGCGLYAGGPKGTRAEDDAGMDDDAAGADAAPAQCNGMTGVCVSALPTGWSPVLRIDQNGTCPSNFTQRDIVTSPMAMPDACTCACNIGTQPSCSKGGFSIKYNGSCNIDWFLQANDGQCSTTNFVNVDAKNAITPPKLADGTCTFGAATGNPTKTTHKFARVCNVPMECQEEVCAGKLSGVSCIQHVGAVACPPGDFPVPFGVYGDTVTVACTACTGCDVTAQCGAGTLRYYSDTACSTPTATVAMDGMCNSTNASGQATNYKYDAPVMNVKCTGTGTTATVDISAKRSICCRT